MMAPTEIRHITASAGIECRSSLSTVTRTIYTTSANMSRFSQLIVSSFTSAAYSLGPDPGQYASDKIVSAVIAMVQPINMVNDRITDPERNIYIIV